LPFDVMVVWNRDHRSILHDLAKLKAELQPTGCVLSVVIGLVAGEEQDVRILLLEIFNNAGPGSGRAGGIAGKVADDNHVLVDRILANETFEFGFLSM